jgi:mercuric reductase
MKDCCSNEKNAYDLIVVGAGSAGFSASITAAEAGKRVALVGHGTIGGTCVNFGCVPSKAMIRAAEALHGASAATRFPGLSGGAQIDDWHRLVASKDDLVATLRQKKYEDLLPAYEKIDYIDEGRATLVDGGIEVGGRKITAPKTLIATGSRSLVPALRGIEDVEPLDSASLLELKTLPNSLIFVGAGYIGAELAQMMARMGVKVTLVARSRLLPGAEPEVSDALSEAFEAEGITLLTGLQYDSVGRSDGDVTLRITQEGAEKDVTAERIVVTAGRLANTEGLGLKEAGVQTDSRGGIVVGRDMQTSRAGVYAAGDVTDRDQFVYMAAYGAKIAARNAVAGSSERYDNTTMPWVVFTDPQVAGVGLSEQQARDAGHDVKTSVLPLDQVPRAQAARDTRGLIKLVADRETDRLLGGQIVAPEGSDTIQTLVIALKAGMTTRALGETIFPYLTTVEGLKLAAQAFDKDMALLSCCAG